MAPNPTIKNISRTKISDESGMQKSNVTFSFDVPVQAYTVNVIGVSWDTGMVADKGSRFISDIKSQKVSDVKLKTVADIRKIQGDIIAEIDWTELYQEGNNRVNIYGKDLNGSWTPYEN